MDTIGTDPRQVLAFRQENFLENSTGAACHSEAIKTWDEKPDIFGSTNTAEILSMSGSGVSVLPATSSWNGCIR